MMRRSDVVATQHDIFSSKVLFDSSGRMLRYFLGGGLCLLPDPSDVSNMGAPISVACALPLWLAESGVESRPGDVAAAWAVRRPGAVLVREFNEDIRHMFDGTYWRIIFPGLNDWELDVGPDKKLFYSPESPKGWGYELG